jgi:uncharacterized membrane protein required for colicin V production
MEYGLLIGVLVFLFVMGLYGYMRGFLKIVLSVVAMFVTLLAVTFLSTPVGDIVKENTKVYTKIHQSVEDLIDSYDIKEIKDVKELNLPDAVLDPVIEKADGKTAEVKTYLANEITRTVFNALIFFVLTIVIYILLTIVIAVLDIFSKLPVINGINKSAGAILGLVQGLILIWVACLLLTAAGDKKWAGDIFKEINDNSILSFIYNNNLLIWLMDKFI